MGNRVEYQGMSSAILPPKREVREDIFPEDIENILGQSTNKEGVFAVSAVFVLDSGGHRHLVVRREDVGFSRVGTEVA